MLDSFRHASQTWVVKLLFVLLILSFVAWGVGDVVRGGLFGHGPAIEVGGTQVTAQEVQAEFKREVDRLQPMFGGKLGTDEARKMGLMDRTIETMVTRILVDEAARRLGLDASNDAVIARIASAANFRNERGQFDRDVLRRTLAKAGLSEQEFLRIEKSNLIRGQLADTMSSGLKAPSAMVDPLIRWREERRVIESLTIRDDQIPAPAAPDAATLETYYKDHAARFMAPELRALTVLTLKPSDVIAQVEITEDMVADAYQARMAEFHTPERRAVQQIVLADQAAADKAAATLKAGKDLAAAGRAGGAKVVDLGLIEKGDLPDAVGQAAFQFSGTGITPVVRSPLGWHVVQVSKVMIGHDRTFAEVRGLVESDLRREKALEKLGELATQVEDAFGGGATVEEVAKRFSLRMSKIASVDAHGRNGLGKPVTDLPKAQSFLPVAFKTEQGTESPLTDVENDGYFLVRVDQVTPPRPKALAEIKAEVIAAWAAERRHAAAKDRATKLAEQARTAKSLSDLAAAAGAKAQMSQPVTRNGGDEVGLAPALVSEGFKLTKPGQVAVVAGANGWTIARLDRVIAFDPGKDGKTTDTAWRRVSSALSGDLVDQYLAALNAEIGVKVDRSQLAREE